MSTVGGTLATQNDSGSSSNGVLQFTLQPGTQSVTVQYFASCTAGHSPTSITVTNVAAYRNP